MATIPCVSIEELLARDEVKRVASEVKKLKIKLVKKVNEWEDEPIEEKKNGFRIASSLITGVYKGWLDKKELESFLREKIKGVDKLLISHETGHKGADYEHTHFVVVTNKLWQTTNARLLDFNGVHGRYAGYNKKLLTQKWNYICKEDNKDKIMGEKSLAEIVWGAKDLKEALIDNVSRPSDVMGIKMLYDMKPQES